MALTDIERLANKTWARALRMMVFDPLNPNTQIHRNNWTSIARLLLKNDEDEDRFQGLYNVVDKGCDPRKILRRVRIQSDQDIATSKGKVVKRKISGAAEKGGKRNTEIFRYDQVSINLVTLGEELAPGSSRWKESMLWRLVEAPYLPSLEDIRRLIRNLLDLHGLCRRKSSIVFENLSIADDVSEIAANEILYKKSLEPLCNNQNPDSICLISSLAIESFLIGNDVLFEIHREILCRQFSLFMANPVMNDIAEEFNQKVIDKLVNLIWLGIPDFEEVSINTRFFPVSPFDLEFPDV